MQLLFKWKPPQPLFGSCHYHTRVSSFERQAIRTFIREAGVESINHGHKHFHYNQISYSFDLSLLRVKLELPTLPLLFVLFVGGGSGNEWPLFSLQLSTLPSVHISQELPRRLMFSLSKYLSRRRDGNTAVALEIISCFHPRSDAQCSRHRSDAISTLLPWLSLSTPFSSWQ